MKCAHCSRKISEWLCYECKCEFVFCLNKDCRQPDVHSCTFDWVTYEKNKLDLPKCVAKKINKI